MHDLHLNGALTNSTERVASQNMKDAEALDFLAKEFGTSAAAAVALNVTAQTFSNWRTRGQISAEMRPAVWAMVNDHGGHLPREWLLVRAA